MEMAQVHCCLECLTKHRKSKEEKQLGAFQRLSLPVTVSSHHTLRGCRDMGSTSHWELGAGLFGLPLPHCGIEEVAWLSGPIQSCLLLVG